jgi:hypothetical protein
MIKKPFTYVKGFLFYQGCLRLNAQEHFGFVCSIVLEFIGIRSKDMFNDQ